MTFYTEYHVNFTEFSSGQRAHTKTPRHTVHSHYPNARFLS